MDNRTSQGDPDDLESWSSRMAAITPDIHTHGNLTERSIASLLRMVREQLNLEVVFVGEFVDGHRVFRHISSKTIDAIIKPGQGHPRIETICQRIVDGRMPCIIPNVTPIRIANGLPEYYHGMGAHVGVPVRFTDGSLYGVLCGFSFEPRSDLDERDVKRLEMAAKAAARLLAQAEGRE